MRLVDADIIIFHEIDEIGGEYEPYLGCSKDQVYTLPTIEAIPKADYEARLKSDLVAMLDKIRAEIIQVAAEETKEDPKWALGLKYSIKIIDKHTAGSEPQESEDK